MSQIADEGRQPLVNDTGVGRATLGPPRQQLKHEALQPGRNIGMNVAQRRRRFMDLLVHEEVRGRPVERPLHGGHLVQPNA
ncbi:hypothetical protein NMK34_06905 [Micromonospora sp. BRA006-A]|uniref:hypothetical protein n=1 Tax=Micromonospora sp. BRA006-A TaxID=2962860 RepID=UPI00296E803D|nr:hypothetical protein [Micromonospora sp. BRA006-A]MDW3846334.1 hypothetical protein [Micromonospora sp. BRA006-A]